MFVWSSNCLYNVTVYTVAEGTPGSHRWNKQQVSPNIIWSLGMLIIKYGICSLPLQNSYYRWNKSMVEFSNIIIIMIYLLCLHTGSFIIYVYIKAQFIMFAQGELIYISSLFVHRVYMRSTYYAYIHRVFITQCLCIQIHSIIINVCCTINYYKENTRELNM